MEISQMKLYLKNYDKCFRDDVELQMRINFLRAYQTKYYLLSNVNASVLLCQIFDITVYLYTVVNAREDA